LITSILYYEFQGRKVSFFWRCAGGLGWLRFSCVNSCGWEDFRRSLVFFRGIDDLFRAFPGFFRGLLDLFRALSDYFRALPFSGLILARVRGFPAQSIINSARFPVLSADFQNNSAYFLLFSASTALQINSAVLLIYSAGF